MSDHLALLPGRPPAVLIARFVAESALEYPGVDDIDGRLYLWQQHCGCWVVAFLAARPSGSPVSPISMQGATLARPVSTGSRSCLRHAVMESDERCCAGR